MKEFETKNLKIRRFKIEDVPDVHKNLATEEALTECLGYNIHKSIRETEVMVESFIKESEMNLFGQSKRRTIRKSLDLLMLLRDQI